MGIVYDGLQEFVEAAMKVDDYRLIENAEWDEEIGALLEATAEQIPNPPMFVFDKFKDYPEGYRLAVNVIAGYRRLALAFGIDTEGLDKEQLAKVVGQRLKDARMNTIPPVEVKTGKVMENVLMGEDVDMLKFPVPRYHAADGGRYIGTYDCIINQDPESGYVNVGTYRIQVHERNLLGLWISPGHHGRVIAQRYWDRGESCPIVATFGQDPALFWGAHNGLPWGEPEFDYVGGLRQKAVEFVKGPLTGLPIPAHAEIAIEGEVPPPSVEARDEGPFGESPGYYSGGTLGTGEAQPVIRVKALYHRNNPILGAGAPLWPGAFANDPREGQRVRISQTDFQIPGVVAQGAPMSNPAFKVIAIKQLYPGHAKQVGMAALGASRGGWIVIVDEDIDPYDLKEVMWAVTTRCDAEHGIDIINDFWSTALNPVTPKRKRDLHDYTNAAVVIYALPPFHERDDFPKPSRASKELRKRVMDKYRSILPFPELG